VSGLAFRQQNNPPILDRSAVVSSMTYKDFYAQALLSSLPIAYTVEKDLVQGREPRPEHVALCASQLAMALTELLANTVENVPGANDQY
jgi:hypothetical protein